MKSLVGTHVSQALQRIERSENFRECSHLECSTAEGRIRTVAMAEAEHAQNNLFWKNLATVASAH